MSWVYATRGSAMLDAELSSNGRGSQTEGYAPAKPRFHVISRPTPLDVHVICALLSRSPMILFVHTLNNRLDGTHVALAVRTCHGGDYETVLDDHVQSSPAFGAAPDERAVQSAAA